MVFNDIKDLGKTIADFNARLTPLLGLTIADCGFVFTTGLRKVGYVALIFFIDSSLRVGCGFGLMRDMVLYVPFYRPHFQRGCFLFAVYPGRWPGLW